MQQHIEDKRKHARNQARNIRSKWWAAGVCPPVSIEYLAEYSGIWLDFFLVIRNGEFFFPHVHQWKEWIWNEQWMQ